MRKKATFHLLRSLMPLSNIPNLRVNNYLLYRAFFLVKTHMIKNGIKTKETNRKLPPIASIIIL